MLTAVGADLVHPAPEGLPLVQQVQTGDHGNLHVLGDVLHPFPHRVAVAIALVLDGPHQRLQGLEGSLPALLGRIGQLRLRPLPAASSLYFGKPTEVERVPPRPGADSGGEIEKR